MADPPPNAEKQEKSSVSDGGTLGVGGSNGNIASSRLRDQSESSGQSVLPPAPGATTFYDGDTSGIVGGSVAVRAVVENSGVLGGDGSVGGAGLYDSLPPPTPSHQGGEDGGYMELQTAPNDNAGQYNTLPLSGQTHPGQSMEDKQQHQGDTRQLQNATYDSVPGGGAQQSGLSGEYMTVTNNLDDDDDDDGGGGGGGGGGAQAVGLQRQLENPHYHDAGSGVPLYDTLPGGDNDVALDTGPELPFQAMGQDGDASSGVVAVGKEMRFSLHRGCVNCYSYRRKGGCAFGALAICVGSFVFGIAMLVAIVMAVVNGTIEIDTGWSSFIIDDLASVAIQEGWSEANNERVASASAAFGTFTPWCAERRLRRDGGFLEPEREDARGGEHGAFWNNGSVVAAAANVAPAALLDECDGAEVGGLPWWSNMAPWFKTTPEAAIAAGLTACRNNVGLVAMPTIDGNNKGNDDGAGAGAGAGSVGGNARGTGINTNTNIESATARSRRATVKGFTMDIVYESTTPECLTRLSENDCEQDSLCSWHPSQASCVGNLLTPENIQAMHEIERTIYQFSYYREESVYLPGVKTLLRYFYAPDGKYLTTDVNFALLTPDQIASFLEYAGSPPEAVQPGFPVPIGSRVYSFFGTSFSASHPRSNLLTSKFTIYEEQTPAARAAYYAMLDSLNKPGLDVLYTTPGYVDTVLDSMIAHDVKLCAYALGFVGICMLIHTASPFLTLMAVCNIAFSFPLALIIYRNVCGQKQALPLLAVGSAFVVIGIAVDDIFVFVDMFKQSTSNDITGRVAHTVQTAVKATLFTSVTSATSFASNALSQIPAVHDFGLLSAILVVANYIMVSTLMLSALVVWQIYIRSFEEACFSCLPACLQPMSDEGAKGYGAAGAGRVGVGGGAEPEYEVPDDGEGDRDAAVMANPVFQFQINGDGAEDGAAAVVPNKGKITPMAELSGANKKVGAKAVTYSWFQRFIANVLTPVTGHKGRVGVVLGLCIWIIITASTAPKIAADSSLPKFAQKGSNLERVESLGQEYAEFSSTGGSYNLPDTKSATPAPSPSGPSPPGPFPSPPGPRPPLTPSPPAPPYVRPTSTTTRTTATRTKTTTTTTFTTRPGKVTTTKTRTTTTKTTTTTTFTTRPGKVTTTKTRTTTTQPQTSTRVNCCGQNEDAFSAVDGTDCECMPCPQDPSVCINESSFSAGTINDCLWKCFLSKTTITTQTTTTILTTATRPGKTNALTTTRLSTSTTNTLYTGAPTRPKGADCDVIANQKQCELQGDCKFVPAGGEYGDTAKCVDINATPPPRTVRTTLPQTFGPDRSTADPSTMECINAGSKGACERMSRCYYDATYKVCLNFVSTTTTTTGQGNVVTETLPVPKNEPGAQPSTQQASTIPNMKGFILFGMQDPYSVQAPAPPPASADTDDGLENYDLSGSEAETVTVPVYNDDFNTPDASCSTGWNQRGRTECKYQRNGLLPLVAAQIEAFCFDFAASEVVEPGQEGNCLSMEVADLSTYVNRGLKYGIRDCLPPSASSQTQHVVKFVGMNMFTTRIPTSTGFSQVQGKYDEITAVMDELKLKYPLLQGAVFVSSDVNDPLLTNAAVSGASWGIATSLVLCAVAVALVVMNLASWAIIILGIIINVASVISIFVWAGWEIGAVEAVSLSVLVGTSVDYLLHLVEAYLNAGAPSKEELVAAQASGRRGLCGGVRGYWSDVWEALVTGHSLPVDRRILRVVSALTSIGVPIIWSAFTTIGSVLVLTACQIEPLQRFGSILATVSACSLFITMVLTPGLLVVFGPRSVPHSWMRFLSTIAVAAIAVGALFMLLFIVSLTGTEVRGPNGEVLF